MLVYRIVWNSSLTLIPLLFFCFFFQFSNVTKCYFISPTSTSGFILCLYFYENYTDLNLPYKLDKLKTLKLLKLIWILIFSIPPR